MIIERRTFLKGAAGLAAAGVLSSCSRNPRPPGPGERPTLRIPSWTSLGYPGPFTYVAGPGYWRMTLLYDTLLWPDDTGNSLPWLASAYRPSPDGLVHRLDLRDVRWDDGRPFTARDVAFTYRYYTDQTFTPFLIGVPPPGIDVVPTSDRTVEFRLKSPDATFVPRVLATMPIVPEHIWAPIKDPMGTFDPKVFVSTGPYALTARDDAQDRESYTAKDGYFLGAPYVQRIDMLPADDPLAALRIGELDAAGSDEEGVRNQVLAPFRDDPQFGIASLEQAFAFPLFFNISRGGALADLRFRRACLHAIDRNDMVTQFLTGNGTVGSQGFVPPSNPYYNPRVRDYPFNRAEAERLLDEGGYRRRADGMRLNPNGSPVRYTLYIPDTVPLEVAEFVAQNLKSVGIDIDLQRIDLIRLFGLKLSAGYDMLISLYSGPSGGAPTTDPDYLRSIYYSAPANPFHRANGYVNPEVDRLLDEQKRSLAVEDRKRIIGRVQELVAEDLPVAVLYYTTMFWVYRKSVFDQWYYTPGGFGPGIPDIYNKQVYITGRKVGTEVRRP